MEKKCPFRKITENSGWGGGGHYPTQVVEDFLDCLEDGCALYYYGSCGLINKGASRQIPSSQVIRR